MCKLMEAWSKSLALRPTAQCQMRVFVLVVLDWALVCSLDGGETPRVRREATFRQALTQGCISWFFRTLVHLGSHQSSFRSFCGAPEKLWNVGAAKGTGAKVDGGPRITALDSMSSTKL